MVAESPEKTLPPGGVVEEGKGVKARHRLASVLPMSLGMEWMLRAGWFLLGMITVIIGAHDALEASTGYQLLGSILLILGLIAALAILPIPVLGLWLLMGSLASALMIAFTFWVGAILAFQLQNPSMDMVQPLRQNWRLLLWSVVLLVVVGSAVVAVRSLSTTNIARPSLKPLRVLTASGAAGAVVVAVGQFAYGTQLAPLAVSPSFGVQGELREVGRKDHLVVVTGMIRVHNASDTRVSILSSLYRVEAFKFKGRKANAQQDWNGSRSHAPAQSGLADRVNRSQVDYAAAPALVQAGRIMPQAWVFDKGEDYNRTFVAYVPDDYDLAELTVELAGAKDSVLELDTSNWRAFENDPAQESGGLMGVVETSWYQRFTQPARLVADRWWFGNPNESPWEDQSLPTIDFCVFFDGSPKCGAGSQKFLGIKPTSSQYDLWLNPVSASG